ncbi:ATP-dependent RNA helicase RhlE [hydrothermal vent metagenome]|uniref:ATP-dependent RNA helicase RhlE n=1 Tax=hydrothermal vent metagenome TaxID=652676 RepID=A0A3B0TP11_9ZZZZ
MSISNAGFCHLGIAPDMLKVLDMLKFVTPTPIQHQAIPIALEGKDVLGIAQTGTGKTLAFGIPTIQRLASEGGQALILVPTRELALQVDEALEPLLNAFQMKSAVLIGGLKMGEQISDIKRNPDLIVATPGRLNDHIYQGTIDLGGVIVAILDEADRMFDMGFEPQVKSVLRCLTNKKQTLLFSATMPPDILKLAQKHMQLPLTVEIAPSGTTTKDVSQELFIVKEAVKNDVLQMLLKKYRGTVLVFTRTKMKASRVTRNIRAMRAKVAEIHSDRTMGQRRQAIEGFKRGRYRVLVATDIAARGIDISMIELVINYDLPDDAENYVHRIGRTGRAGETGHAVTLATPTQGQDVHKIQDLINMILPRTDHPQFPNTNFIEGSSAQRRGGPGGQRPSGSFKGKSQGKFKTKGSGDFKGKSQGSSFKSKTTKGFGSSRKSSSENPSRRPKKS